MDNLILTCLMLGLFTFGYMTGLLMSYFSFKRRCESDHPLIFGDDCYITRKISERRKS